MKAESKEKIFKKKNLKTKKLKLQTAIEDKSKEDLVKQKKKKVKKSKLEAEVKDRKEKPLLNIQKSPLNVNDRKVKSKIQKSKQLPTDPKAVIKKGGKIIGEGENEKTGKRKRKRKKKKKVNSKRNKYLHLVKQKQETEISTNKNNSSDKNTSVDSVATKTSVESPHLNSSIKSSDHRETEHVSSLNDSKRFTSNSVFISNIRRLLSKDKKEAEAKVMKRKIDQIESESTSPKKKKKLMMFDPENIKQRSQTLQNRMTDALKASQFRYFNEQLYKCTGARAFQMFHEEPSNFQLYHEGYKTQVEKWPVNPLDIIIEDIKKNSPDLIVADFGCGDAQLARNVPNQVHSFDLQAVNDLVTACDMAEVPLKSDSVDIVVFCLSLMGTNLLDYFQEAHRVLRRGGLMKIAEVESRFRNVDGFIHTVEKLGFTLKNKNSDYKMFVLFDMVKTGQFQRNKVPYLKLDPCLYKKR